MIGLSALMRHAELRGDGLLPQLRDFFAAEAQKACQSNIVDLLPHDGQQVQAGPNPTAILPDDLPENVVMFRQPVLAKPARKPKAAKLAPRKSRAARINNRKS